MKKYFIVALLLSLTCGVCHAQRQNSGVKEFEAECLGVEGDGSQTIRAYGFGKDKDDAVEQAQKNAVKMRSMPSSLRVSRKVLAVI